MGGNRRALPSWMLTCGGEHQEEHENKRKIARKLTVYCMNEAELVEAACAVLAAERKQPHRDCTEQTGSDNTSEPPQDKACDGKKRCMKAFSVEEAYTCGSPAGGSWDTNPDVLAEEETVPYTGAHTGHKEVSTSNSVTEASTSPARTFPQDPT